MIIPGRRVNGDEVVMVGGTGALNTSTAQGGRPLALFWRTAWWGAALVCAAGVIALVYIQEQARWETQTQLLHLTAQSLEQRLSTTLGLYHRVLEGLVSNPQVRQILEAPDGSSRRVQERSLAAALFPEGLRLRLLPPEADTFKVTMETDPPLTAAALDLLRIAGQSQDVPPLEMHAVRAQYIQIVGAALVPGPTGKPAGLLLATFGEAPLRGWMEALPSLPGRLEVQQKVAGRYVPLWTNQGIPEITEDDPDMSFPVAVSLLRVAYWYKPSFADFWAPWGWAATTLALMLGLAGGLLLLQQRRLERILDADQALLLERVDDQLSGQRSRSAQSQPRLQEWVILLDLLLQRLQHAQDRPKAGGESSAPGLLEALPPATGARALPPGSQGSTFPQDEGVEILPAIFAPYAIHGTLGETLSPPVARQLGRGLGSQALHQGQQALILGRDVQPSSRDLMQALREGIRASGCAVIDLGVVPAPLLHFATCCLESDLGLMVSGDSDPLGENWLRLVRGGEILGENALQALHERLKAHDLLAGAGVTRDQDLVPDYIERVCDDVRLARPLKVVVDCGNGGASSLAPGLYQALGCEVVKLHCDLDPSYPNHPPDPSQPQNLKSLQAAVLAQRADLGLAFDGDGDRLGLVDSQGRIIWPDRLLMLLAADLLMRQPGGDVIFDVTCSRALASQILRHGGRPLMWRSGHAPMQAKLRDTGALLGGERSGRILYRDRWHGFGDALYAGARLLEILAEDERDSAEVFAEFPDYVGTPELFLALAEGDAAALMEQVQGHANLLTGAKITTIDGLRAEFPEGWGLVRACATRPALSFRFEADDEPSLLRIQARFRTLLQTFKPDLCLPF